MTAAERIAIIGTGFLGRSVTSRLVSSGVSTVHTCCRNPFFRDSLRLDLLRQGMADVLQHEGVRTVIITAKFEDSVDRQAVADAMGRNVGFLKDKRVVYISSDAVFDGLKGRYSESDPPAPLTAYGINKLACEDVIRESLPDHCIIRTSYIYGHSCGVLDPRLAEVQRRLRSGEVVERFVDMYKSPIEVNQLADAIVGLAGSRFIGTIHVAGERVSVFDFYRHALDSLGEEASRLRPVPMPRPLPSNCLIDTSLDASLFASTRRKAS